MPFINIMKSFIDIKKSFINIKKSFININKCSFCPLWPSIHNSQLTHLNVEEVVSGSIHTSQLIHNTHLISVVEVSVPAENNSNIMEIIF